MDVEGKEKLTGITDTEMQTGMKGMKKVDRANCPNMVEEGRCGILWEIRRHYISKSHHIMKLLENTMNGKIRKRVEQ